MTTSTWSQASFDSAVLAGQKSLDEGGVPIGAALDLDGELVASGHNERVQQGDPIAHGEMSCLRQAGRLTSYKNTVLYTTLAPCAMCAGAIVQFQIPLVIVGEDQTFTGELEYLRSRGVEVIVLNDQRCIDLMNSFKTSYPDVWLEDIGQA